MDLDRINSIFDAIDTNKSGDIDPSELILHLLALGQDHESISALFKAMDTDGNGSISRAEFVAGFEKMEEMTAARELEESEALYAGAEGIGSLEQVKFHFENEGYLLRRFQNCQGHPLHRFEALLACCEGQLEHYALGLSWLLNLDIMMVKVG